MSEDASKRVYPSAPLEEVVTGEQQQHLLSKPAPPTYNQAIGAEPLAGHATPVTTAPAPTDPHVVVITRKLV